MCFEKAAEAFKLIEDDGVNVIVNWGNCMDLVEQLKVSGCTYGLMKQLAQFTVSVKRTDFKKLCQYGVIEEILEGVYVLPDRAQYNCHTGLSLDNHWMDEILTI